MESIFHEPKQRQGRSRYGSCHGVGKTRLVPQEMPPEQNLPKLHVRATEVLFIVSTMQREVYQRRDLESARSPILILSSKEEIDVMIRENEEALAELQFPDDDALEGEIKDDEKEEIKKDYSPHDDEMEDIDEQGEEAEIIDVDESDSVMINQERLRQDLINYNGGELHNIDPEDRITRFILFKIADFCVHQFEYWRRYVFDETDNGRAKLLAKGIRHDITGEDHPVLRVGLGGVFALERGLPVTVDDGTLRDFYQDRAKAPGATLDAEERVRRYKFSVMVTKLIEALYRRGYDLGGDFRTRVQACNSMSEQTTVEAVRTRAKLREDVGIVEAAMKEAL